MRRERTKAAQLIQNEGQMGHANQSTLKDPLNKTV